MVWRCRGGNLVQLHLLLKYTIVTTASQKLDIHSGVFHTYRCKSCLAGLLAVSSLPSFCHVKNLSLFAWRHPGIVLVSAAACTVLVLLSLSLSHLFQSVFLLLYCVMKMSRSQVKLRGWVLTSKSGFVTNLAPSSFFSRGILLRFSLGEGRWFSPWQYSALPVTGARTEPARPGVSPLGWSGRRLGAFSPRGREARGFFPGSAALGPGGSCLPFSPLCWERQRLEGPLLAGPAAARCLQVRFLLLIYSRNSALPSVVVQGIAARVRIQKRALANAKIRRI